MLATLGLSLPCAHAQYLSLDPGFDPGTGADAQVTCVLPRTDGKVMVLGSFLAYGGSPAGQVALINADGTLDPSFSAGVGFNGPVQDAVMQPDGKVLVCGQFTSYNGTVLPGRLIRLMPDGTLDPGFQQLPSGFASINSISLMDDGRIVLGGNMGATNQTRVCRLLATGVPDPSFNTWLAFNNFVSDVDVLADGKILVVGGFTMVHGVQRNKVCVLNADGSLHTGFDPGSGPDQIPNHALVTSAGRIVLAGAFQQYNSTPAHRIVVLQADGSIDPQFASGAGYNASVTHLSEAADDALWVAGNMATFNGTEVAALHKLMPDGSVVHLFPATNALDGPPIGLASTNGSVIIGGSFTTVNGVQRVRLARLIPCPTTTWYADEDGDGLGDPAAPMEHCYQPVGYVHNDDDCDDTDPLVTSGTLWYMDQDEDGFGNIMAPSVLACSAPLGYVANNTDCNDFDPTAHLLSTWYADSDGDEAGDPDNELMACSKPTGYVANDTDCDDTDPSAITERDWFADADGDGFGDPTVSQFTCTAPQGYVANHTDCDDGAWWITVPTTWYLDEDEDGSGTATDTIISCTRPVGYAPNNFDCDDADPDNYLNAPCDDTDPLTHHDEMGADCVCRGRGVRVSPVIYLDLERDTVFGMQATLFDLGLIPLTEPYTQLSYTLLNDVGTRTTTPEMLNPIPTQPELQAVDWVLVELRDKNAPAIVLASQACLLRRNGTIHRPDMIDSPEFRVPEDHYYVSVRHRTHLGVMTSVPIDMSQPTPPYINFTDANLPVNGGVDARRPRGDALVLWQGDVRFNGNIQYTGVNNDREEILVRIGGTVATATVAGYHIEDVNMDGIVKYTGSKNDRDVILQAIGGVVPTTVRQDHLPD